VDSDSDVDIVDDHIATATAQTLPLAVEAVYHREKLPKVKRWDSGYRTTIALAPMDNGRWTVDSDERRLDA
jgi:hypothetical protein